ncbi:Iron(III) dicitrate transport ATP-binding protein fecE [Shigella dysenteriae 1617]|uniref:Iron(III) dicitrate transport ATP-binding protein fecE n=1 Tax=Shigella dysenteriae 1617 TaxID=754093 RepID=A0A0A6ZRJ9_SHIDY|nr:Iron(III) dicitrate transport ATP-binding protein fecE [Shigella dysenteriae 1617]
MLAHRFSCFCCYAEVASDFACRPSCVSGLLPPSGATRRVLHPVARTICCLLGANGCGKTTLMRSILGVIPLLKGEVLLDSLPVQTLSHRQRAQAIAWVPQAHDGYFCF